MPAKSSTFWDLSAIWALDLLYVVARALDFGHNPVQIATADYGTKFAVVAGLLNFIAAIDAHNIGIGRKS